MTDFVLVHGAWHGAWCWAAVARHLEAEGHRVIALDLPGHGEDRTPVADVTLGRYARRIAEVLETLAGEAVLVGPAAAGMAISAAAEISPERISALVYLCAYLPGDGESLLDLEGRNPRPTVPLSLLMSEDGTTATLEADKVADLLYGDCSPEMAADAARRLTPQAIEPFGEAVRLSEERFGSVRRVYVECTRDEALSIELQRDMIAAAQPIEVHTLDCGHSPFLSMPDRLAEILMRL